MPTIRLHPPQHRVLCALHRMRRCPPVPTSLKQSLPGNRLAPCKVRHRAISQKELRMRLYESVFIARQDISSQQVESMADEFAGIITNAGGKIHKREYWGLRS
ncbi:MAG: 30S ribosomal protein S6, partial [Candidatus Puniceispirillaceae bacterium]